MRQIGIENDDGFPGKIVFRADARLALAHKDRTVDDDMGNSKIGEPMTLIGICEVDQDVDLALFKFLKYLPER